MLSVGQTIYLKRLEKNLTQIELVQKTGIPQPNLSNIEKGKQDLTVSTFLKICHALEVRPAELLDDLFDKTSRKPIIFSRPVIEKIAKAVVHEEKGLSERQREIADLLKLILPAERRKFIKQKDVYRAWMELRRRLNGEEIKILLERIQDERQRAA